MEQRHREPQETNSAKSPTPIQFPKHHLEQLDRHARRTESESKFTTAYLQLHVQISTRSCQRLICSTTIVQRAYGFAVFSFLDGVKPLLHYSSRVKKTRNLYCTASMEEKNERTSGQKYRRSLRLDINQPI